MFAPSIFHEIVRVCFLKRSKQLIENTAQLRGALKSKDVCISDNPGELGCVSLFYYCAVLCAQIIEYIMVRRLYYFVCTLDYLSKFKFPSDLTIGLTVDLTDDKLTLGQVMGWCHQAISHYPNQCWSSSTSTYWATRSFILCVSHLFFFFTFGPRGRWAHSAHRPQGQNVL